MLELLLQIVALSIRLSVLEQHIIHADNTAHETALELRERSRDVFMRRRSYSRIGEGAARRWEYVPTPPGENPGGV